jgi:hypothetical protein
MKTLFTILLVTLCAATGYGQTMKALSYNASNGLVAYSGTNTLEFTNKPLFASGISVSDELFFVDAGSIFFDGDTDISINSPYTSEQWRNAIEITWAAPSAATTRTNLGLGATWLTNTNVTNFRSAIGLGATNNVTFNQVALGDNAVITDGAELKWGGVSRFSFETMEFFAPFAFDNTTNAATTRTNLGLGATNNVVFNGVSAGSFGASGGFTFDAENGRILDGTDELFSFNTGLITKGDLTVTQTGTNNGLLFIRRTNNESFLGLANLIASNNTTISNETLFRVGTAEATNRSAQFGFRSTNTNGSGVAVFSVFGYNALMMVGADASTNAVIYSGGGTNNEVMTLIRDGATEFARPIRFSTNASTRPATNAPANTTNVAAWVEFRIGTNSYRAPLYQ